MSSRGGRRCARGAALAAALALFVAPTAVRAQAASAPAADSGAACDNALAALQARETAVLAARRDAAASAAASGVDASLRQLQRAAARACLGPNADTARRPQRELRLPQEVPPVAAPRLRMGPAEAAAAAASRVAPALPRTAAPAPPAPPVLRPASPPPPIVTGCDATACTGSDGTVMPRMGPDVLTPRGLCSLHGTALVCP
jgi:hypothetical protein